VPKGGGQVQIVATETVEAYPHTLAADAGRVCWATFALSPTANIRCALADGALNTTIATGIHAVADSTMVTTPRLTIHPASGRVFFTVRNPNTGGGLYVAPFDGSAPAALIAGTSRNPIGVGTDGDAIFVAFSGTQGNGFHDGSIARLNADGSDLTVLAADLEQPTTLAVDGDHVYYRTLEPMTFGTIWRLPTSGPAAPELVVASGSLDLGAIYEWTVGRGTVLFTTYFLDKVIQYDPVSGEEIELAQDPQDPFGIAADQQFVFWVGYDATGALSAVAY
jgi:hypothetical protein